MEIIFTREANHNFLDLLEYLTNTDSQNTYKIFNSISTAIDSLKEFPYIGVFPKETELEQKGYRILIVEKYLIFYVVNSDIIEIRYLIHGSRAYWQLVQ